MVKVDVFDDSIHDTSNDVGLSKKENNYYITNPASNISDDDYCIKEE